MSKKIDFINYVEKNIDWSEANEDVINYWNAFKGKEEDKPLLTDNGKLILKYMQEHSEDVPMMKSRDIADEISLSSRTVSGSMRKLVDDGFVEKIGKDPVIYSITEAGKKIEII